MPGRTWKTRKRLQFQAISSGQQIILSLEERNYRLTLKAREALTHPELQGIDSGETDLIFVDMEELDFTMGMPYNRICARALEYGLHFCRPPDGPLLRLGYDDQPVGEHVVIGMPPLHLWGQPPLVFVVDHSYGRYLRTEEIHPKTMFWPGKQKFCFRQ